MPTAIKLGQFYVFTIHIASQPVRHQPASLIAQWSAIGPLTGGGGSSPHAIGGSGGRGGVPQK